MYAISITRNGSPTTHDMRRITGQDGDIGGSRHDERVILSTGWWIATGKADKTRETATTPTKKRKESICFYRVLQGRHQ